MTGRSAAAPARRPRGAGGHRTRGSASVEYAVVTAAIVLALFAPIGGADGTSALGYLLDALRDFQKHTTVLHSLP